MEAKPKYPVLVVLVQVYTFVTKSCYIDTTSADTEALESLQEISILLIVGLD